MKTISGSRENISQKLEVLGHDEESRAALVNKGIIADMNLKE